MSDVAVSHLNPDLEPTRSATGAAPVPPLAALTPQPSQAQVKGAQQLLFAVNPRALCEQTGLNWWAAVKLYEDGWLSFSPENTLTLDEAQETELRFLGALVAAGCDRRMLVGLLQGLSRPYAYDLKRLYYDWTVPGWRMLPDPHSHPEAVFADWVHLLGQGKDYATLRGIIELAQDALLRLHSENQ